MFFKVLVLPRKTSSLRTRVRRPFSTGKLELRSERHSSLGNLLLSLNLHAYLQSVYLSLCSLSQGPMNYIRECQVPKLEPSSETERGGPREFV